MTIKLNTVEKSAGRIQNQIGSERSEWVELGAIEAIGLKYLTAWAADPPECMVEAMIEEHSVNSLEDDDHDGLCRLLLSAAFSAARDESTTEEVDDHE